MALRELKQSLKTQGVKLPTLFKQYSEICEDNGVQFLDFNIDSHFGNCIDGLVVVDITQLKAQKRKRYLDNVSH